MIAAAAIITLFWRFLIISLLAFGAGSAALPLIERMSVSETGMLTEADFGAAVSFGYATPGPVLILATFIGYRAAGVLGSLVATVGVFLGPWVLATLAAQQLQRYLQKPWLRAFGKGAAPAIVGLLGITAWNLIRKTYVVKDTTQSAGPIIVEVSKTISVNWVYILIGVAALVLSLQKKVKIHPLIILIGGALLGVGVSFI